MELEKMQKLWNNMTEDLEQQKSLTKKLIIEMTQVKYNNLINSISSKETIGSIICLVFGISIIPFIGRLDTWYLMLCGVATVAIYLIIPFINIRALKRLKTIRTDQLTIKQTIIDFQIKRDQFLLVQRIIIGMSFILLFIALPVIVKITDGKDLFLETKVWFWYLPLALTFLTLFVSWGYNCYKNITNNAEKVLSELYE